MDAWTPTAITGKLMHDICGNVQTQSQRVFFLKKDTAFVASKLGFMIKVEKLLGIH